MKTDAVISTNEIDFVLKALEVEQRIDGRKPFEFRPLSFKFYKDGTAEVQLGKTRVVAVVTAELVPPFPDRPSEGTFALNVEFSPMASPSFEAGRPGEDAVELARALERGLKDSGAVDLEALVVLSGRAVWALRTDVHVVDNGGGLAGAASLAALAGLVSFRRPEVTVAPDTGAVTVHPAEVREPLALTLHHLPIAVEYALFGPSGHMVAVDPTLQEEAAAGGSVTVTINQHRELCAVHKAGGVAVPTAQLLRCLRVAAQQSAMLLEQLKKAESAYRQAALQGRIRRKRPLGENSVHLGEAQPIPPAAAARAAAVGEAGGSSEEEDESEDEEEGDADEDGGMADGGGQDDAWDKVEPEVDLAAAGGAFPFPGPLARAKGGGGGTRRAAAADETEDAEDEFERVANTLLAGRRKKPASRG